MGPFEPILSVNLSPDKQDYLLQPYHIRQYNQFRVGIIGVTGKEDLPETINSSLIDWESPFAATYQKIKKDCDLLVVLSSLSDTQNTKLTKQFPEVGILVSALPRKNNLAPKIINNTLVMQAGSQGKHLGRLDLHYVKDGKWAATESASKKEVLEARLQSVDWQINRLAEKEEPADTARADRLAQIKEYRQQLVAMIAAQQKKELETNEAEVFENSYQARVIAIKPADDPTSVSELVGEIHRNIQNCCMEKVKPE